MKVFRKILKLFNNSKSYYPREYYYERLLDKYSCIESYLNLAKYNNKQALFTDKNISFSNNPNFIKNPKKFIKKYYGKPNFTIVNYFLNFKITILFYRIFLGNYKVKLELHFSQNTLIMYSYTFSYLKYKSEKNNILNVLKKKYKIEKKIIPNNYYIVDKKNTMIVFSDIDFTIYYINYINSDIYNQMINIFKKNEQFEKIKRKRKEQELYKKL